MKYLFAFASTLALLGCGPATSHTRAVYMLVDTSGTYTAEIEKVDNIANYLLGLLNPEDSLGLARIDSASFSEKNIIARVTFDPRPSYTNQQKRTFRQDLDRFVKSATSASHTDISGGMLQAAEWLHETRAEQRYILVFSDLEEDLVQGHVRDFPLDLEGVHVVALNVTKLRSDQVDPREYLERLEQWKERVEMGGGTWQVINDLERLDGLLS